MEMWSENTDESQHLADKKIYPKSSQ